MRRLVLRVVIGLAVLLLMSIMGCWSSGTSVAVAIDQQNVTLSVDGTQTFTATVIGTTNTDVTWSVVEAGGGSITVEGVYTAPAIHGTYHVKAVSAADTKASNTAAITVQSSSVGVTIQ